MSGYGADVCVDSVWARKPLLSARASNRNLPVLSDSYYRNGELHDDLSAFFRARRSVGLTAVSPVADVPLKEQNDLVGETMKMSTLLLVGACTAPILCAQQVGRPIVDLKTAIKIEVPMTRRATQSRGAVCDGAGNVYTRQLESGMNDHQQRAALPIRKITPEGSLVGSFRVLDAFANNLTGKGVDVMGKGIFVTTDGRVFQTADVHGDVFVVEFSPEGSVKAKTKLATGLRTQPWLLAVFKSGEYLLTATTGKDNLTPFTAVFAADGRLVKKIYEPEDEEARQKASPADWDSHPIGVIGGADFVRFGDVAAGSDGNIYLLHGTASPALVYVISPGGDVVRKLRIDAGDPDLLARSIKFYAGRLAIEFDRWFDFDTHQNLIKVTDLEGNSIADYRMRPVVGNHSLYLAGYGSEGFTFMPYENEDKLYLVKAKLP